MSETDTSSATEQQQPETVDDWRAEAEKWKTLAAEREEQAKANQAAAARADAAEQARQAEAASAESKVAEATEFAGQTVAQVRVEATRSVSEWQAEAEKWKQLAARNEQQAKSNVDAVKQLERVESRQKVEATRAEQKLAEAQEAAREAAEKAVSETSQSVEEWQAEAERWKQLSRTFEGHAKSNASAAVELEKLRTTGDKAQQEAAVTAAQAEERAAEAEARALRFEVAEEMGVPKHLTDFLTGKSKKEIEAQADALLASIESRKKPEPVDEGPSEEIKAEADALAEAQRRAAEAEVKALRYEVAATKGLPHDLARFLSADTKEGLQQQADVLLQTVGGQPEEEIPTRRRLPQERLRSGAAPDLEPEKGSDEIAAAILRRNRGY
jgi:colicin import membrane protein